MPTYSMMPKPLYAPARLPAPVADPVWAPSPDIAMDATPRTGFLTQADLLFWLGIDGHEFSFKAVQTIFLRSANRARVLDRVQAVEDCMDHLMGIDYANGHYDDMLHAIRSTICYAKKAEWRTGFGMPKATRKSRSLKTSVADPRAPSDPARIVEVCEGRPGMLEILTGTGCDTLPTGNRVPIVGGTSYARTHYGRKVHRGLKYDPCTVAE